MENADTQKTKQRKKNTTQCNVASHYMSAMVLDKCARALHPMQTFTLVRRMDAEMILAEHTISMSMSVEYVCACVHSILLLLSGKRITVCVCVQCAPSYVQLQWHKNKKFDITKSSWRGVIRQQNDKNAGDSILLCNIFVRHSAFLL